MSMTMQGQAERGFAQSLAYGWARLYTKGMTEGRREHRLQQIESDLFEHTADRKEGGASPSLVGFETLERFLRGIPADVLWRFQMEGINMQIRIPVERLVGAVFLVLVAAMITASSISGYDTAKPGWEGELYRLARLGDAAVRGNLIFQVLAGIGLIALAAALFVTLSARSRLLTALCSFALAAAGVLTLVASALYFVITSMADDFAGGARTADMVTTSRAFALAMQQVVGMASVLMLGAIYVLAIIGVRTAIVPRQLGTIALASVGVIAASFVIELVAGGPEWNWAVFMAGVLLAVAWLVVAGGWMLLGNAANTLRGGQDGAAARPA